MMDLASLSLAELREVAAKLAVAGAAGLKRAELERLLSARADEVEAVVDARTEGGAAMLDGLPSAGAPDAVPAVTSGAGPAQPVPLEPPRVPIADLPWAYDDDRLVLLVRDPRTLYAYWDFHPKTVDAARSGWPQSWAKLRLLGLGRAEPQVLRELDVDLAWKSYYLYDLEPNRDYRVELVMRGPAGEERLVGHSSNVASLPPSQPSAWVDDRFVRVGLETPLPLVGPSGERDHEGERRLHQRAYELSGGEGAVTTADEASSSRTTAQGFGGRAWSGTLVRQQ